MRGGVLMSMKNHHSSQQHLQAKAIAKRRRMRGNGDGRWWLGLLFRFERNSVRKKGKVVW